MLDSHPHHAEAKPETSASGINPASRPNRSRLIAIVAVLVAVGIAITGILSRRHQESEVAKWTTELAVPVVATVTPKRGVTGQQVSLPGDIEAWFEAPIYARVSGYLKAWYFDFGAHVEKGQLLAEIDAPDLDAQLAAAKARLASAEAQVKVREAERNFAETTYARWRELAEGRRFRAGDRSQRRRNPAAPMRATGHPSPRPTSIRARSINLPRWRPSSVSLLRSTGS